jgi:glycerol-3-phosphate dehydrogenase (NAD(P)+)
VVGGGSWGTAIACHLARNGHAVRMWVYEKEVAEGINTHHINPFFLSDISLPESIRATTDMEEALAQAGSIVMVVPSNFYRRIAKSLPPFLSDEIFILNASKGIEDESLRLMTQILEEELPEKFHRRIACLSGPSFAREVAGKKFTAVTIASSSEKTCVHVRKSITLLFILFNKSIDCSIIILSLDFIISGFATANKGSSAQ